MGWKYITENTYFTKKVTLIQEFAIKRLNSFYTYHTKYNVFIFCK